ncbi:hypothetical protein TNCV_2958931 [Trichonephila clavipes]|nr:hypothetical protein TNCV_2958931 [Trichonephila clavipes]
MMQFNLSRTDHQCYIQLALRMCGLDACYPPLYSEPFLRPRSSRAFQDQTWHAMVSRSISCRTDLADDWENELTQHILPAAKPYQLWKCMDSRVAIPQIDILNLFHSMHSCYYQP